MAKKNRNVLLVLVLFFLAAGGGSYLFREPILTRVATFLVVSDPLHKADAMEILGGGISNGRSFTVMDPLPTVKWTRAVEDLP